MCSILIFVPLWKNKRKLLSKKKNKIHRNHMFHLETLMRKRNQFHLNFLRFAMVWRLQDDTADTNLVRQGVVLYSLLLNLCLRFCFDLIGLSRGLPRACLILAKCLFCCNFHSTAGNFHSPKACLEACLGADCLHVSLSVKIVSVCMSVCLPV